MEKIVATTKAHEIMKEFPEITDYLVELGICGCSDGHESDLLWTVEKIAREKDKDLDLLLEELNKRRK